MKILFVAMPFSIHTARWLSQLTHTGWDIHLYSSMPGYLPHDFISDITFYDNFYLLQGSPTNKNKFKSPTLHAFSFIKNQFAKKIIRKIAGVTKIQRSAIDQLSEIIHGLKPDIIHSFETQHSGYLVTEAKKKYGSGFPVWIHSNWGIDLHFFGKLKKHIPLIKETLSAIDVLVVEGRRDEMLARNFGFRGLVEFFPSVGGGFIIPDIHKIITSKRKKILVKGMQDLVRRGLVALRALERCADLLEEYEIVLYSSNEITQAAAELFFFNTGKKITVINHMSHGDMLQLNAEARLNICVNMSDGLPNAMLEAMMMGAFPIQSYTSVADEWIEHERTGMLIPPEDPDIIEMAIRKALTDDEMVDNAARVNRKKISEQLDYEKIKIAAQSLYTSVIKLPH